MREIILINSSGNVIGDIIDGPEKAEIFKPIAAVENISLKRKGDNTNEF